MKVARVATATAAHRTGRPSAAKASQGLPGCVYASQGLPGCVYVGRQGSPGIRDSLVTDHGLAILMTHHEHRIACDRRRSAGARNPCNKVVIHIVLYTYIYIYTHTYGPMRHAMPSSIQDAACHATIPSCMDTACHATCTLHHTWTLRAMPCFIVAGHSMLSAFLVYGHTSLGSKHRQGSTVA